MVNIAVVIDCYHNDSGKMSPTDLFQYNIVDTINELKLDHVYVCSYDIPLSELNSKNEFYKNTRKLLTEKQWKKKEHFLSNPSLPVRETSKIILNPSLYNDIGMATAHLPMEIQYDKVKKV